ncbi:hypothetical protein GURASL_08860 [Geotalea uraniireducens]|uniref:HD-GYP domain-containing protein n=1 Tax=Geotalea uraniireducens TaxID=351604 RepID=A0ABM8EHL0_9BACT|nr:HD domain-containing phosphohydrolase [Geotalea uraniireducens]BDV41963.1 hypothetical protein GURASL_08860 [Geotalea uraniireducens]
MNEAYYRPVSIEAIEPDIFPAMPLYLRRDGNHVLYKGPEQRFAVTDRIRLEKNNVEFLYVRTGDLEELTEQLEASLPAMLGREDISGTAKGKILYQTAINYLDDLFTEPERTANAARCRDIAASLVRYATTERRALAAIASVVPHNYYTFVHSIQVTALALMLHADLGHPGDDPVEVAIGSLLHDFGMAFIPREIINQPHSLKDVEYLKIKQHPQFGYDYLEKLGVYGDTPLAVVRLHHERSDGTGYPLQLKGNAIPHAVQLVSLCDVYCALTTDRPYRKATGHSDAVRLMREELRGAFDREMFRNFESLMGRIVENG